MNSDRLREAANVLDARGWSPTIPQDVATSRMLRALADELEQVEITAGSAYSPEDYLTPLDLAGLALSDLLLSCQHEWSVVEEETHCTRCGETR